jgi:phosphate transport system substrate-binding protein
MKTVSSILFVFFAAGLVHADEEVLRLHGSNTIGAQLAPALVEAWLKNMGMTGIDRRDSAMDEQVITARDGSGRRLTVEIKAHGSSTAFTSLVAGEADIGMSSRPIKPEEVEALRSHGSLLSPGAEYVIGLDGIAVIVHPQNRLTALDKGTIARIFAGEIRDWKQVGGTPGPIHVYARDDRSGTLDTFKHLVLDKTPLARDAQRFESSVELSDAVAADPAGIGFIGLPYVRRARALAVAETNTMPLQPTPFSVATEDYALSRRLYFYVPPDTAHALARSLAEFAVSAQGQTIVVNEGFVDQSILAGTAQIASNAPDEYRALTGGARRLSINFRFREGSVYLDNKALRDAQRLAAWMDRPENAGAKLILCGFSDANEVMPLITLDLSNQRADQVAEMLLKQKVRAYNVRGFGAVPVAAEETPSGRNKNRRVEVWIRHDLAGGRSDRFLSGISPFDSGARRGMGE